ncbi:MAG TPA: hypothetical protein VMB21_00830 [Candidatus Limnocylindria bacterium]|jgi:hypothetical protein|nr:hypothetical protein [Candidatus Limnocylindria bacterium]
MNRKRGILAAVTGGLLLLCLIVGGYGFISRQPPIVVRFAGYEANGNHGWLAVFRATNGAPSQVICQPSFLQGSDHPTLIKSSPEVLAPRSSTAWIYSTEDTNLATRLQIEVYTMPSLPAQRWNGLVREALPTIANYHWLMFPGRKLQVICPAEAP